jgi:DNA-binding transcriptional ArsR family regulator
LTHFGHVFDLVRLKYIHKVEWDMRVHAPHMVRERVRILKALAHPARLGILLALREVDACVCHLTALLGERQPYVSQQLSYLRAAGLVDTHKVGLNVFYHVTEPRIFQLLDSLGELEQREKRTLREKTTALSKCTCPRCKSPTRGVRTIAIKRSP